MTTGSQMHTSLGFLPNEIHAINRKVGLLNEERIGGQVIHPHAFPLKSIQGSTGLSDADIAEVRHNIRSAFTNPYRGTSSTRAWVSAIGAFGSGILAAAPSGAAAGVATAGYGAIPAMFASVAAGGSQAYSILDDYYNFQGPEGYNTNFGDRAYQFLQSRQ